MHQPDFFLPIVLVVRYSRCVELSLCLFFSMAASSFTCCQKLCRRVQSLTVALVMRFLQAAFYELARKDSRVKAEVESLPEGAIYDLTCFGADVRLSMQAQGGALVRLSEFSGRPLCAMQLKSLGIAFRLLTGQQGLFAANAQHGFTVVGDVAATMKFVRLVTVTEAYLFPHFWAKHLLPDVPAKQCSSILLYLKIICGLITNKYTRPER